MFNPSSGKGDMELTPNSRLKLVTFNCDLDLKSAGQSYGLKFKENPSTGIGDTEGTRNSRLKPVTLNCDLDLVSAWLCYEFCILSQRQTYDQSLKKILPGVKEIQSGHEIQGSNP